MYTCIITAGLMLLDPAPHPLINFVVMATKLATEVLKFDWSVSADLQPMTSQLFSTLQKYCLYM